MWVRRLKDGLSVEQPITGDELCAIKRYSRCARARRDGIVEIEIGLGDPNLPARSFITAAQIRQARAAAWAREEAARRSRPARAY